MEGVGGGGRVTGCEKQTGRADYNTKVEEKYNGERRRRGDGGGCSRTG